MAPASNPPTAHHASRSHRNSRPSALDPSTRKKTNLTRYFFRIGRRCWPSTLMAPFLPPAQRFDICTAATAGSCHLYWVGSFSQGIATEICLCNRQTRPFVAGARPGERGCQAQCALARGLSGFRPHPLLEKQIPKQAKEPGISETEVVRHAMLGNTVERSSRRSTTWGRWCCFSAPFPPSR